MGATSFSGEKNFIGGNISTLLGRFQDEIYAAAEEDSYNEREQYLLITVEIEKECIYRHFGVYDFDSSDCFYSPEKDGYIVHKEHENSRYEVISMKVVSVLGNVIEFENVFSDGYHDWGESHYLASYATMEALKDGDTLFLLPTDSYADKNLRFATPEEAEASLKNQFR